MKRSSWRIVEFAGVWFACQILVFIALGIPVAGLIKYPLSGYILFGVVCISAETGFLLAFLDYCGILQRLSC